MELIIAVALLLSLVAFAFFLPPEPSVFEKALKNARNATPVNKHWKHIMKQNIQEVLKDKNDEQAFYAVSEKIAYRMFTVGYEKLKEGEKKLFGVGKLISEVNNGGFDQYYFNTDGKYAADTLEFLKEVGLNFLAELLLSSISISMSDKRDEVKLDEYDGLDNKVYNELDYQQLYTTCIAYIRNNIDRF